MPLTLAQLRPSSPASTKTALRWSTQIGAWFMTSLIASWFAATSAAASPATGPFGAGLPEDGISGLTMFPRLFGAMIAIQTYFNEQLTRSIHALRHDASAAWQLMAIAFFYGVVHAIGPGHGKAVVSSYVVANRQTVRNGVILAFLASFAQAAGAVALILVATAVLHATSVAITVATYRFEIVSDLLVIALGLWLLWTKAIGRFWLHRCAAGQPISRFEPAFAGSQGMPNSIVSRFQAVDADASLRAPLRGLRSFGARAAQAAEPCDCGALHIPTAQQAAGALEWKKIASVIATTALRPCAGALIVLVFARVQGVMPMGILAVFVMGLGTAMTVAALAVVAASVARTAPMAGPGGAIATRIKTSLEIAAALAVLVFGALMLAANLSLG